MGGGGEEASRYYSLFLHILWYLHACLRQLSQVAKTVQVRKRTMMIISWSGALPAFLTHKPCALLHFFFQDNWPLHYKGKCRHRFKKCMLRGQLTDYRSWNSILQPQVSLAPRQSWSTFFCPCTSRARWPRSSRQKVDLNLIMTSVLSHHLSDKKKKPVL